MRGSAPTASGAGMRPVAPHGPRMRGARLLATAALAALALTGCAGLDGATSASEPPLPLLTDTIDEAGADPTPAAQASLAETALEVLDGIPVADRTEWDGYFDRAGSFGEGWADLDGDGCNTRQETLADDLDEVRFHRDGCRVDRGVLDDPYSGERVEFTRGQGTSELVQIDHVVALYNAWRTGAQELGFDERVELANDPLNLQATVGWVNDDKGSQDASQWLPPNEAYHCTYVARQIAVKASYGLWVTPAEDDAMREVLATCQ